MRSLQLSIPPILPRSGCCPRMARLRIGNGKSFVTSLYGSRVIRPRGKAGTDGTSSKTAQPDPPPVARRNLLRRSSRRQRLDPRNQLGKIRVHHCPDLLEVHTLVEVDQLVTAPGNQPPRHFWVSFPELRRQSLDGLSDHRSWCSTADWVLASARNSGWSADPLNSIARRAAFKMSRRCASSRDKIGLRRLQDGLASNPVGAPLNRTPRDQVYFAAEDPGQILLHRHEIE